MTTQIATQPGAPGETAPLTEVEMISVVCPENAPPGTQLSIVSPTTGAQVLVTLPPGVQPGQQFQVQVPAATAAAPAGTPQGDSWVNAFEGTITCVPKMEKYKLMGVELQGASGQAVAGITCGNSDSDPMTVNLPDGTVVVTLKPVARRGGGIVKHLRGNAGETLGEMDAAMSTVVSQLTACAQCAPQNAWELHAPWESKSEDRPLTFTFLSRPW
mmetsp:Transcript_44374/g.120908  ORF Transcript_44374/g.120908 Transcript_44374/m.120908 type:complete len:215 (-) Transcript_44374:729-1373(-)